MRETRPSGSVRGVRSDPYPYRDTPSTRCRRQRAFDFDLVGHLGLAGYLDTHLHRAGFATPTGSGFGPGFRTRSGQLNRPG